MLWGDEPKTNQASAKGRCGWYRARTKTMGTPQDPRARRRERIRRAKKNLEWEQKRARENAEAAKPKAAKTAT